MIDPLSGAATQKYPTEPIAPLGIVAMRGCEEIGRRINQYLMRWQTANDGDGLLRSYAGEGRSSFLVDAHCPRFGTGEGKGMLKTSVRGYDLYIIVDVGAYDQTYNMYGKIAHLSPDEHFADLKRVIAAVGGKAKRINVIMPFLYESRQHRRTGRESLDCALALQELEKMGVQNILTFDAHDPRVQNAVPLTGFESVMPSYQLLKALLRSEKDLRIDRKNMMIISPDEGALDRNIYYSSVLGLDLGMFYKRRDYTQIINGRNPIIKHEFLGDDVEGKDLFVADDMISTGDSMLDLARELKARKANRIYAAATFAFFTDGLDAFHRAYEEGIITKVLSTNLTYRTPQLREAPWFIEADLSKYIAYMITTLNHDRSLSDLLEPWDRIKALMVRYRAEQTEAGLRFE
ncbi:MAG: ribose-phosphate pyrophosphokinase [Clostridia bacterium]|nr:ribose-phosphate pyrophosphokinase [Clostridia bacterium]